MGKQMEDIDSHSSTKYAEYDDSFQKIISYDQWGTQNDDVCSHRSNLYTEMMILPQTPLLDTL